MQQSVDSQTGWGLGAGGASLLQLPLTEARLGGSADPVSSALQRDSRPRIGVR